MLFAEGDLEPFSLGPIFFSLTILIFGVTNVELNDKNRLQREYFFDTDPFQSLEEEREI